MRRPTPPRERRGGTCPPARPGGSSFRKTQTVEMLASQRISTVCVFLGDRYRSIPVSVSVLQLARHLFEYPPLVAGQTVEPML